MCRRKKDSPKGRSVPLCFWKTVAHRYPVEEEQMHRRPRRTRRPIRNWVSVTTPLCLRNGARETREKTRKGMRGVGREMHVTSRDPTLNAVGTRSCAIRRGMSKKRATAISLFDQPWFLDPLHFDCCDFEEMVPGVGHLHRRDCLRALCGLL
jgi:hypothetical protein